MEQSNHGAKKRRWDKVIKGQIKIWNKVIVGQIIGDGTKESWDKEKEMEQRNHGSKKEMIQRNNIYIYIITYRCVCVWNTDIAKEVVNIIY